MWTISNKPEEAGPGGGGVPVWWGVGTRLGPVCPVADPGFIQTIITTRKQSLGQGNMFTGVCLSTGGGAAWSRGGVPGPSGGAWSGGGAWSWGGAWSCGVSGPGGSWSGPGGRSPERLLLWAVRILLEYILVWQPFYWKLHENERNWTERGRARPWWPLDPQMMSHPIPNR